MVKWGSVEDGSYPPELIDVVKKVALSPDFSLVRGILLCQLSAAMYALGVCTQRYALSSPNVKRRNLWWAGGIVVYSIANMLYCVTLTLAPLSLMSAVFTSLLIYNAVLSQMILGETITRWAAFGQLLVVVGIISNGVALSPPVMDNLKDAAAVNEVFAMGEAQAFVVGMGLFSVGLTSLIVLRDARGPKGLGADNELKNAAMIALLYPVSLASWEVMVQIVQKAGSTLVLTTLRSIFAPQVGMESQVTTPTFWVLFFAGAICTICVLYVLRRSYERFETKEILPIQYSWLTTASVVSGLIVFDEDKYLDSTVVLKILIGFIFIGIGVGIVYFENKLDLDKKAAKSLRTDDADSYGATVEN